MYVNNWFKILNRLWKNVRKPQARGGGDFWTHTVYSLYISPAYINNDVWMSIVDLL